MAMFQHFILFYPIFIYILSNDLANPFANYFKRFHKIRYSLSSLTVPTNIINFIISSPCQTYVLLIIISEHTFDVKMFYISFYMNIEILHSQLTAHGLGCEQ